MKMKLRNISGVDKAIQVNGYNYVTVKPNEIVEREIRDENSIPDGWELVKTTAATTPAPGKKATGKAPVVVTENLVAPIADSNVTTSAALKGII